MSVQIVFSLTLKFHLFIFLLCLRVELLLLILYSAHVEPSPASIFLSFQVSYKDKHITYEHSFLSFFLVWILLILLLCCLGLPDNWVTSAEGDSLALFLALVRKLWGSESLIMVFFCIFPFVNWGCFPFIPNTPSFKTSWIGLGSTCMTLWLSLWCRGLLLWGLNVELLRILTVRGMLLESHLHLFLGNRSLMSFSVAI